MTLGDKQPLIFKMHKSTFHQSSTWTSPSEAPSIWKKISPAWFAEEEPWPKRGVQAELDCIGCKMQGGWW